MLATQTPTAHLLPLDWVVIAAYFVALVVIGLYYRRFASRSMDEYFLSGRRNSGWAAGVSYAAALMNADVAPTYSGLTVVTGVFICWWYIARFGPALFVGAMLFAVFWRRLNLFTTPEFYELRFGGVTSNVVRAWVAIRSSLIAMVAWTGTGLLAMYKIANPVIGVSKTTTMFIVLPIVLVYVFAAGFAGVVASAGLQSLIMFVGSAMLCGTVLYSAGGPHALQASVEHVAGPSALAGFPPADHSIFPAAAVIAWLIGTTIGYGVDTAPLGGAMEGQHLLSSKNTREASKMYLAAEVTLFVLLLLVTLPALGALVEWPWLRNPGVDREQAYGLLMARHLPTGMLGLLFVVMLASVMAAVGNNLIFGSQILVNDMYRRYVVRERSDAHYLWVGRLAAVAILALALLVAYNVDLIFQVAVFMVAASAAELPSNWAQWWWWRFNSWGRLAASFGGIAIPALVWFVLPTREWTWWNRTYLVIGANTALWIIVTLVTPPDRKEVLEGFYRRARPLGAWGPVRGSADANHRSGGLGLIVGGLLLALIGAGAVALMTQGLSHLYVARYQFGLIELACCAVGATIFLRAYGPYLDRLEHWSGAIDESNVAATPSSPRVPMAPAASGDAGFAATSPPEPLPASEPLPTSIIVAISSAAFGVVIIAGGLIATRGMNLALNLIGGVSFVVAAVVVSWAGREPQRSEQRPVMLAHLAERVQDHVDVGAGAEE
jgi:Na+/proline symporter